ncbi:methyltransferase [Bosea sp. TWI1241]|uniref:tRNA1(Val) (adenine(37)-N6)-methyltransferase n=1 Tax=Bosea sp. TWI1241 TaxID=3148904 RepID=UPI00320A06B1
MADIAADGEVLPGLGPVAEDRVLGGALRLLQPCRGHRAGSDAILLAAAIPDLGGGTLADFGAGAGTVGLAVALRQPALSAILVERDPELAGLAARNAALNGLGERVATVTAAIGGTGAGSLRAALPGQQANWVAMNPPFFQPGEARISPVPNRGAAHVADTTLASWLADARRILKPRGGVTIIHRAEALGEILAGLGAGFGAVSIRPVHAQAGKPAIRVLVSALSGSRKPAEILPAFVLNDDDGRFTPQAEAVHRGAALLA